MPLAIWPVAQTTAQYQRTGRYLPGCAAHPGEMLPELARQIVTEYSTPGQVVLDPLAGIGTTLVEAALLDRRAAGVELEQQWADLARANLDYARSQGATGHGEVVCGDARYLTSVVDSSVRGLVALGLTSPPCGPSLHGQVTARPGKGIRKSHTRYSTDQANLAHVGLGGLLDAMRTVLIGCARVLRPDGVVAMTVRPWWHDGQLVGLPRALVWVDQLVPRASFFALEQVRKARSRGVPRLVTAREDFLVFVLTCSGSR